MVAGRCLAVARSLLSHRRELGAGCSPSHLYWKPTEASPARSAACGADPQRAAALRVAGRRSAAAGSAPRPHFVAFLKVVKVASQQGITCQQLNKQVTLLYFASGARRPQGLRLSVG